LALFTNVSRRAGEQRLARNSAITGNGTGNTITGTEVDRFNVLATGTGTVVGTLTINSSFSATRQQGGEMLRMVTIPIAV